MLSGAAAAQSSVAIYGRIDVGYKWTNTGSTRFTQASGQSTANRLGFRGVEDLGGGLRAEFVIEQGFNADDGRSTQHGGMGGRQSYVGLSKANVGEVRFGRQYALVNKQVAISPFGTSAWAYGTAGHTLNTDQTRINNAFTYVSPKFAGLTVTVQAAPKENDSNGAWSDASTAVLAGEPRAHYASAISYANGPVFLNLTVSKNYGVDTALARNDKTLIQLAGTYDFGAAKLFAQVERDGTKQNHGVPGSGSFGKKNSYLLGATVDAGAWVLRAAAGLSDNANRAAAKIVRGQVRQLALGADYSFSKRTAYYVGVGWLKGDFDAKGSRNGQRTAKSVVTGFAHYF